MVEGDSKIVVDAISGSSSGISSFHDIILSCHELLDHFSNVFVVFVKRNANIMAHALSRVSRLYESPSCWDNPPDCVVGFPNVACTCG